MEISDVYEGESLLVKKTDMRPEAVMSFNRKEQAEMCVFLAATRPQMILTAIAAAEAARKKEVELNGH
jgi:acyl-CoA hydrolase